LTRTPSLTPIPSLQVFYNLKTLPEVILLVIDTAVKRTVDRSREVLDFNALNSAEAELLMAPKKAAQGIRAASAASSSANIAGADGKGATRAGDVTTLSQLRLAIREIAQMWANR
jgi:hypothetical protein